MTDKWSAAFLVDAMRIKIEPIVKPDHGTNRIEQATEITLCGESKADEMKQVSPRK